MRQLRCDDAGVSPVIGVILAVAITVTLGAIVYLVSTNLTSSSQQQHVAPRIGFTRVASGLQVATSPTNPPVDWTVDLRPGGTCYSNANLKLTPLGSPQVAWASIPAGTKVSPGDVLGGCQQGETLTLSHVETNTVVYTYQF
jgi:flagellin-like protein